MNLTLQSYWLCMSLLKTLKDSDCAYYMFIFHNYFVLTIPSMWKLLCMRVSTTSQLWLLDCIHLSQNAWCYTGDTCVSVLCECVYDWLSMLVQLYMLLYLRNSSMYWDPTYAKWKFRENLQTRDGSFLRLDTTSWGNLSYSGSTCIKAFFLYSFFLLLATFQSPFSQRLVYRTKPPYPPKTPQKTKQTRDVCKTLTSRPF